MSGGLPFVATRSGCVAEQPLPHLVQRRSLWVHGDMGVDVHGGLNVGVPKDCLGAARRHAEGGHESGAAMPKIVEPHGRKPALRQRLLELVCHVVAPKRRPGTSAEHQALLFVAFPQRRRSQALGELARMVGSKAGHDGERDGAPRSLGLGQERLVLGRAVVVHGSAAPREEFRRLARLDLVMPIGFLGWVADDGLEDLVALGHRSSFASLRGFTTSSSLPRSSRTFTTILWCSPCMKGSASGPVLPHAVVVDALERAFV